jgi:hypothetical protein
VNIGVDKQGTMPKRLKEAFAEASRLRPDEQDRLATWILEELASERRWQEAFANSADVLEKLAHEARAEYYAGRTHELDLDKL